MDGRPRLPSTRMPSWPRGIAPRAPHRSGLDTLASSGSCHRTKAAAFRRELETPPVASWLAPNGDDLPPSLHEHYTRFITTTGQSAPLRRIGTFGLAVGAACAFPCHRRPGSHVPYQSQIELRAAYMPDAAWAVSVHPPSSSRKMGQPPVLTSSNRISTLLQRFACARLSQSCLSKSCSDFSATFTTIAFDDSSLRWLEINP